MRWLVCVVRWVCSGVLGLFVCCVGCWLAIWLGFGLVILVSDVACY